ncbi:hypothetical protein [Kordiimonas aquimaris]|uniref:hypothetical protein n=1 Tax=Kordiimonas aquimaris TaxID=707591 RepID=UPI0021D0D38C|nr:hypothetical protein [Kordiimonas aquimaris]
MVIHDARAVMGVLSRLIAGGILALMFDQYFASQAAGTAFVKSRIWWEIVLNLQLLSAGMIWYSYSDRVTRERGRLRTLQMTRLWLSVFASLTPTLVGLAAVFQDWFEVLPGVGIFVVILIFATVHLIISLYVYRQIEAYRISPKPTYSNRERLVFYAPTIIFISCVSIDLIVGANTWFIIMPIMLFSQGSMPYVFEALGLKSVENYA